MTIYIQYNLYFFFLIAIFLFRCPRCPICRGEQHTTPSPPSPPTALPRPSLPSRLEWVRSPLGRSQTVPSRGEEEGIIITRKRQIPGNIKVFKFYRFILFSVYLFIFSSFFFNFTFTTLCSFRPFYCSFPFLDLTFYLS